MSKQDALFLYNTLTREKMKFVPLDIDKRQVRMYTCGPTVYNYAHIGNLRTYVFEDILKRALTYNNYQVRHVMNITDVGHLTDDRDQGEDKIEKSAAQQQKSVWDIAEQYTRIFQDDLRDLNIIAPDVWCKATEHIQQQIDWIVKLEKQDIAYRIDDGIYYDTSKFSKYGDFARLDIENLKEGARVETVSGKRNATDFALWKFSPKDAKRQMEWDSPWGTGFPGWHIECSAMSIHYLGEQFDIHCGGVDHIPVHHTNEIAQVEAITGKQWVRYWLHGEFLLEKEKMSKSTGNFLTLQVLKDNGYHPLAYRYFLLNAHYRKQLFFSEQAMTGAQNGFDNLRAKVLQLKNSSRRSGAQSKNANKEKYQQAFINNINDDLNLPKALATAWEVVHDKNLAAEVALELIRDFDSVLGLQLDQVQESPKEDAPEQVWELLRQRQLARKNKDWQLADRLRDEIHNAGYAILDTKQGAELKKT